MKKENEGEGIRKFDSAPSSLFCSSTPVLIPLLCRESDSQGFIRRVMFQGMNEQL